MALGADAGGQAVIVRSPGAPRAATFQLDPGRLTLRSDEAGPVIAVGVGRLGKGTEINPGHQRGVGGQLALDAGQFVRLPGRGAIPLVHAGLEFGEFGLGGVPSLPERVHLPAPSLVAIPDGREDGELLIETLDSGEEFLLAAAFSRLQRPVQVVEQAPGEIGLKLLPSIPARPCRANIAARKESGERSAANVIRSNPVCPIGRLAAS